jgi:hypothetical protein
MNHINKKPISSLGYGFVAKEHIPKGKNEYYLRNIQNRSGIKYRRLTVQETTILVRNGNTSDNWDKIQVSDAFSPELVQNCKFYGLVRIGKLEPYFLEFNNIRLPVGLYNSTIISCDFGDNVVVDNVNFISHYIIGNDVMLVNINELATTDHSKFGNGILREGEKESVRIWVEVCNENAGRRILPFNGMQSGDAYLWSKYRDDEKLLDRFKDFTEKKFDRQRGYYGKIGDRCVIKNSRIIKDVWIGSDAYIKGANKLKNLTINSSPEAKSQIGEGCELVNGIIGEGCRIFYGVKAVRFILGSHSQLKYGARLINSFLGDNSTISCCEVLNSLIFPAHEQHHNNSFLCAATVMGQSNMAAGATIGSNHNSRGADGEIVAGRGFWPGLCVSLKHNSKFASFTLIAKGDFPAELNIPIPFSLVSNDVSRDRLVVMPAYWFMYNMYALARNAGKYEGRDRRIEKIHFLEYDFLAPDSINEIFDGLKLINTAVAAAWLKKHPVKKNPKDLHVLGQEILNDKRKNIDDLEILIEGFENTNRKVELVKAGEASRIFRELIVYYAINELLQLDEKIKSTSFTQLLKALPLTPARQSWQNIGGQLIPAPAVRTLIRNIKNGKVADWDDVHAFYTQQGRSYSKEKANHAFASLLELLNINHSKFTRKLFNNLLEEALITRQWMSKLIFESRAKDYDSPFRRMVYETEKEMENVIGKLENNSFIAQQKNETLRFSDMVTNIRHRYSL